MLRPKCRAGKVQKGSNRLPLPLPPVRPDIGTDDPALRTDHPRPERRHRHVIGSRVGAHDDPMVARAILAARWRSFFMWFAISSWVIVASLLVLRAPLPYHGTQHPRRSTPPSGRQGANKRATLLRLGFPECAPRYLGIAFTDDLRERSVAIHRVWPPENGGPPNAGTPAGRVLDLCPGHESHFA
jgi:hypothetical protein